MALRTHIAAIVVPALFVGPAALYHFSDSAVVTGRSDNGGGLDDLLRSMGFNPINPPSNIIGLGSIYQVSADGREYRTICPVGTALLSASVSESPSTRTVAEQLQRASFALEGQFAQRISDKIGADKSQAVRYTLSDVRLLEVPLAVNRTIFTRLIEDAACRAEVDFELRNQQFVCQSQTILEATAAYDVATGSTVTDAVQLQQTTAAVKEVIEADAKGHVETSGTKLITGSALHYGVKVNPLCVAPPQSRFARSLPRNRFDQAMNFIKFRMLEPILPATPDQPVH
jgi:hypothetical protein